MKIADAIAEARKAADDLAALAVEPDDDAYTDTLDGMTDALDVAAWLVRKSIERDALAASATEMMDRLKARHDRFTAARDRLRAAAVAILEAGDIRRLERPDFTASVRATPARAVEMDRDSTPAQFRREEWKPDKDAIRKAMLAGGEVDGWTLSNGGTGLTVRTK